MAPYDNDFTGGQTSGPENDPYAGGRRPGTYNPTPEVLNTPIPPSTGSIGSPARQGGNTYQSASRQIQDAYRTYLGKDATPQDIANHLSGGRYFAPKNVQHAINGIASSEEAGLYSNPDTDKPGDEEKVEPGDPPNAPLEPTGGTGQAPGGFNQGNWEDDGMQSVKYAAGRFLAGLTKPSEIAAMVKSADFQDKFPKASFDGKDRIDFKGALSDGDSGTPVGSVDVLMRANEAGDTSGGFWWGAGSGDGTPSPEPGATNTGAGVGPGDTSPDWAGFPEGSPLAPPQLIPPPGTFSVRSDVGQGGGGGTMGNMMTPYNPLATYSPEPYVPPDPYRPPAYESATPYQPGTYDAAVPFSRGEYEAAAPYELPTAAEAAADPSYQFRLQQGLDALERSGAARGITNTGATMKGLFDYGANSASQEYASVDARKRDTYDTAERNRFNAYAANFGNAMDAYGMNERNRFGAFGENERNRAGAFNTNEANRAGGFNTNVRNAETAYNTNERNRFQGYTTNEIARLNENQTAENRRAGAYNTNARNFQDSQNFGLRAQNQGWRQGYDKWVAQYNQQRTNRRDNFDMMRNLGEA